MSTFDDFDQFYSQNKNFFNLFEDMPIRGILKSVWQKNSIANNKIISQLHKENEQLKIYKGEAEAKIEARNLEIKRKNQINISIIEQQKFFTQEIEDIKNKKNIALNAANTATQNVEKIKKVKKEYQDRITTLNLHIIKQDQLQDELKAKNQELKAELDKLIYEKEELNSYAKNYKQLNNKLSNEVFRLSQHHQLS